MTNQEHRVKLPGSINQVREACEFVAKIGREVGLNDDGVYQIQLSVEEIFTNIVEHGYKHNGANKSIELVCIIRGNLLEISIIDEAPPFNPLELSDPDPENIWERETGGWGVYFVRRFMDDIRYQLDPDNRNHLILEKRLSDG